MSSPIKEVLKTLHHHAEVVEHALHGVIDSTGTGGCRLDLTFDLDAGFGHELAGWDADDFFPALSHRGFDHGHAVFPTGDRYVGQPSFGFQRGFRVRGIRSDDGESSVGHGDEQVLAF